MIDPEVIRSRLDVIRENIELLLQLKGMSENQLASDPWKLNTAKYCLQVSIEAVTDICKYLISQAQAGMPKRNRDLPILLSKIGVLPKEFAERVSGMIGVRNVLVHGYLEVNLERVRDIIQHDLGDFDEFAKHIVEYLEKEGIA